MTKETIKYQLQQALKTVPHKETIKSVALFGSYINGQPTEDSDVDVLIDLLPEVSVGFFAYCDIQNYLSDAIGRKIDLVTPQALSRFIRDSVLGQAEIIYER
jgi:hypothetical protein